jgi:2-polyprenyl-3-methyl-5-hydroxy-6-metoxy-1,4-benzoquinol methylase
MRSHIQGNTLEIGCGVGSVSPFIASTKGVTQLTSIDIDPESIAYAQQNNTLQHCTFATQNFTTIPAASYNSIVCSNVLEHIEHDVEAVQQMSTILTQNGTLCLLVPAHQLLYSAYDHSVGHFRRYTKKPYVPPYKKLVLLLIPYFILTPLAH